MPLNYFMLALRGANHIQSDFIIILSRVYNEPIQRPAPSWLVSLIGRTLHRYRRGQGSESRTSLIFFFRLFFRNCTSCVYNCNDHLSFNSYPKYRLHLFIFSFIQSNSVTHSQTHSLIHSTFFHSACMNSLSHFFFQLYLFIFLLSFDNIR